MPQAAVPLAAEAAVATTMTAAEIAAAEAAAAAAAEAATVAAAEQAAAQAATQVAAEQAATQTAAQTAAQQGAAQSAQSGITQLLEPNVISETGGLEKQFVNDPLGEFANQELYNAEYRLASTPAGGFPPEPPPIEPLTELPAESPLVEVRAVTPPTPMSELTRPISSTGLGGSLGSAPPIPNASAGLGGIPAGSAPLGTGADAGIQTLAREVGVETQTAFNPSQPFANQTMFTPPATPPAAPNFTSTPTMSGLPSGAPPAGADQFTQMQVRNTLTGQGMNPGVYQEAVAKTPFSTVGSTPTQFAGNTSNFGANPVQQYTPYDQSFGPAQRIPTETGGLPGAMTGQATVLPAELGGTATAAAPEGGGIQGLFNQGLDYVKKNPLSSAMFANTAYNYLNKPPAYEKPKYKSTFNSGAYSGYAPAQPTPYTPQYAHGGLADLGGYSDGGHMLKGPGDGMSDDIPATIANKQPARLANEEFVIPADVVSHLGNGSSEAGAKQLYKMMDRVRKARTGNKKQGKQINPEKYLA